MKWKQNVGETGKLEYKSVIGWICQTPENCFFFCTVQGQSICIKRVNTACSKFISTFTPVNFHHCRILEYNDKECCQTWTESAVVISSKITHNKNKHELHSWHWTQTSWSCNPTNTLADAVRHKVLSDLLYSVTICPILLNFHSEYLCA